MWTNRRWRRAIANLPGVENDEPQVRRALSFVNASTQILISGPADLVLVASRYLRGLGIALLSTAVAYPVYRHFDPVNIAMVYLLGTTIAASRLGRGPSALTATASVLAFDYFFVPPRYSFYIAEPQYLFTMIVMLGVALVVAHLVASAPHDGISDQRRGAAASLPQHVPGEKR